MSNEPRFNGDKKTNVSIFANVEKRFVHSTVKYVPQFLETYHLTLLGFVWSIGIVVASYLAQEQIQWLWLMSLGIILHYVSDLFDGAVGRYRNTGLVKWGYYMDHFVDYFFLGSIMVGYTILLPPELLYHMLLLTIMFIAFMVQGFLSFATTNDFVISHFGVGPTEARLLFVIINTIFIFFGIEWVPQVLPFITGLTMFALFIVVYRTQKVIWKIDMDLKHRADSEK